MSGGTFGYDDFKISYIIDEIDNILCKNTAADDQFSDATIEEIKKGREYLRLGMIYAHRIDWLCANDDGENQFHRRLKEDLAITTEN